MINEQKPKYLTLSRKFIYSIGLLFAWFGISSALYAVITRGWGWGILEFLFSAAVIVIITNRKLLETIETHPIPIALLILLFMVTLLQGYSEAIEVLNFKTRIHGNVTYKDILQVVSSAGFLILLVPFMVEFFRLLRERT